MASESLYTSYRTAYALRLNELGCASFTPPVLAINYFEANDVSTTDGAAALAIHDAGVFYYNSLPVKLDPGRKDDKGKPDWSLLPLKAAEEVVKVLTFGAAKYSRGNWAFVPDGENRYLAAALRHLAAHQAGERSDSESGESHLAHAACCILFLIHKQLEAEKP